MAYDDGVFHRGFIPLSHTVPSSNEIWCHFEVSDLWVSALEEEDPLQGTYGTLASFGIQCLTLVANLSNGFAPLSLQFKDFMIKGSLGGETSVLRTFRMSGKELVKERVSKERVRQGKS